MLRCSAEHVERLIGCDPLSFHQDALRLTYQLSCPEGFVEVPSVLCATSAFLGGIESELGEGGEELSLGSVGGAECGRKLRVEVEGTQRRRGQGVGEHTTNPDGNGCRTEGWPSQVIDQIIGVDGHPLV